MELMKPHLYGTSPYVPDAHLLDAEELSRQSGGNTGNLLFCHALSRVLEASPVSIPWGADISHLSPASDRLVLPLANQLGAHVDLGVVAEDFSKVGIPMVGIGLGAQGPIGGIQPEKIPEGTWAWLRAIAEKAPGDRPNIALRGAQTHEAIKTRGLGDNCVVTGCPSNFINPSAMLGREIYRRRANGLQRVVVAAGNPFLPEFRGLEQSLVAMVEQGGGLYVCQHPIEMLRLVKQEFSKIQRVSFLVCKDYIHPGLDGDAFLAWFRRYGHSFSSVPEWLSFMHGFDVVVGTRIHGVMAAIQAGVPGLCLCIDSRTLELCRTMMIPHADANEYKNGITTDQVAELLRQWDWRSYDDTRRMLAERMSLFLRDNGLEPRNALAKILKNASRVGAECRNKSANSNVEVSTASFDERYRPIFTGVVRALDGNPAPKILSFGCSDGFEPSDLARKHFHHASIVGCDIDDEALRIAREHNRHPGRVHIVKSERDDLLTLAPFDAVIAIEVLCRWPDTKVMDAISELYSFEKFSESIKFLVSLLRPDGVLCVYNSNYLVTDTASMEMLDVVDLPGLLPPTQPVRLFNASGQPLQNQKLNAVLFRKRHERDGSTT